MIPSQQAVRFWAMVLDSWVKEGSPSKYAANLKWLRLEPGLGVDTDVVIGETVRSFSVTAFLLLGYRGKGVY